MSSEKRKKHVEQTISESDAKKKNEEEIDNDNELSELEEAEDSDEIDSDVETESETDVIDFTSDKLYQVLSGFFEAEDGTTITDAIMNLNNRLDRQNDILKHIAKQLINMQNSKNENQVETNEKTVKRKNKKDSA